MKAIRMHRTGGPAVLRLDEIESPEPGRGEVLVAVRAASVNPVDTKIREGKFKLFRAKPPAVLGRDIAGVVRYAAAGAGLRAGDEVFGMLDYNRGAYAQFAVGSARELAVRPAALGEREAGVIGVAGLTAWQGLFDHGRLRSGQRVLIHGAAGGVGHFAVQFAKWRGAHVIATAGRGDLAWVRKLGADEVIDYRAQKFEEETGAIDLVFDLIGGDTLERSWGVLKPRGGAIISTLEEPSRAEARKRRARAMRMVVEVRSRQLREIARLIVGGKVSVTVARVFPLEKMRQAHELVENGHVRGKVGIRIPPA